MQQELPGALLLTAAADQQESGQQRGIPNEDSLLLFQTVCLPRETERSVGLFAIVDGMSGHRYGLQASQLVMQTLRSLLLPGIVHGFGDVPYAKALAESVQEANRQVHLRNCLDETAMGATLVAALVVDTTAYLVSVGNCRAYLFRDRALIRLTRDHTMTAMLVEQGVLPAQLAATHPWRKSLYRSLGHAARVDLDEFVVSLHPDDQLLLCSNGLWKQVEDQQLLKILVATAGRPAQACQALGQAALAGGEPEDDMSCIVVSAHRREALPPSKRDAAPAELRSLQKGSPGGTRSLSQNGHHQR